MPDNASTPLKGIEDAEAALQRVEPDVLALSEEGFLAPPAAPWWVVASEGEADGTEPSELDEVIKRLAPRWFVMRNLHRRPSLALLPSRTTRCWLRGPVTRHDLRWLARGNATSAAGATRSSRPRSTGRGCRRR